MGQGGSKILKAFVIVLVVAAVLAAVGLFFYYKYGTYESKDLKGTEEVQFNSKEVAGILLQLASTTMPTEFKSSEQVEMSSLSESLRSLVLSGAQEVEILKVKYAEGSGYSIKYNLKGLDMFAFDANITRAALQNEWKIIFGTRANQAGIMDLENETSKVRITYSPIPEGGVFVELKSVETKNK